MTALRVLTGGVTGPLGDGFQVGYVAEDGVERRILLRDAWSMRFERCPPVRRFPSYKGQKHCPGRWWSAVMGAHVRFESWLERDNLMLLDFDPAVAAVSSQPFWLFWTAENGKTVHTRRLLRPVARRLLATAQPASNHLPHPTRLRRPSAPRANQHSLDRHARSARWFVRNRLGGCAILYHRHVGSLLARDWSRRMGLFIGTVAASAEATTYPETPSVAAGDNTEPEIADYERPTAVQSDYLDTAVNPAPWPTREALPERGGRPLLGHERKA